MCYHAESTTAFIPLHQAATGRFGHFRYARGVQTATKWVEGRFELRECLGKGAQGETFAAWDREREVEVAIKRLVRPGSQALYRFKREFRLAVEVRHPNLVPLRELIEHAGEWYLVMDRIAGAPLDETLSTRSKRSSLPDGRIDWDRITHLLSQLVNAVSALHDAGIIHRDLKPSNVLVDAQDRLVLLDFGLATRPDMEGAPPLWGVRFHVARASGVGTALRRK